MTDADKLRNYVEAMSLNDLRRLCEESGIDVIPPVAYEPHLPDYKRDVLKAAFALQEREPVRWTRVMRAAGIRMYNPKLYSQMEPEYVKYVRDFIQNWELFPPVKHQGKQVKPWRAKPLLLLEVWRLSKKSKHTNVPQPFEFEEFLRRHADFQIHEYRASSGSPMYELSPKGVKKRRRIDRRKALLRWIGKKWQRTWTVWRHVTNTKESPVLSRVITAVAVSLVFWAFGYFTGWFGLGSRNDDKSKADGSVSTAWHYCNTEA